MSPKRLISCLLLTGCLAGVLTRVTRGAEPAVKPLYVFLSASVDDHINGDFTRDRIRRILAMLAKARQRDPKAAATLLFSGAMSEELERSNGTSHLLDSLKEAEKAGLIRTGYDGNGEPTYSNHPLVDLADAKSPEEHWSLRVAGAEKLLTSARDPLSGALRPTGSGGLKKEQEVFGPASYIRGVFLMSSNLLAPIPDVGADSEIIHALRRLNTSAVLEGLTDTSRDRGTASVYRGWVKTISTHFSPDADTSPELFWQEGVLRSSETGKGDLRVFRASTGAEKLKATLKALDRSRPRVLHIEIGSQMNYAKPNPLPVRPNVPLTYAYDHPSKPAYPAELRFSAAETEGFYQAEEETLQYLIQEYFPANPGSRFVVASDLKTMAASSSGYQVQTSSLRAALRSVLASWGREPLKFLRVEDHYLSEADLFGTLAEALAQKQASVAVRPVYGPVRMVPPNTRPATGEVTPATVARVCETLIKEFHTEAWTPIPRNAVPAEIAIEGKVLNPAQFLRLMADALVADSDTTKLRIQNAALFWGPEEIFYRRRPDTELGYVWTFKPAVLH